MKDSHHESAKSRIIDTVVCVIWSFILCFQRLFQNNYVDGILVLLNMFGHAKGVCAYVQILAISGL
jgi:ABC-type transport system involved in cytochrome c biogenesis permease component